MEPDDRTGLERVQYIAGLLHATNCGDLANKRRELVPMYRDVLEEARRLAKDKAELKIVSNIMWYLDRLEIGENLADENAKKRAIEWSLK